MSEDPGAKGAADPFAAWRSMYQMGEESWSQMIDQMIGTQAFAQSMNQYLDNYLKAQEVTRKQVEANLGAMNVPTKSDLTRIAGQIVALDAKVDDLQVAVEELTDRIKTLSERGPEGIRAELARIVAAVEGLSARSDETAKSGGTARQTGRSRAKQGSTGEA
jgi:polyhydroxyalkanoic acid synthase PhaR subunit